MHKIAFLLKTYDGDKEYVKRLIPSYHEHNSDRIPLFMVVPESSLKNFEEFKNDTIQSLSEESITDQLTQVSVHGVRPGYINQEIIKLAFWEKRLCENYFCIDSDGVFIRDFFISDFMYNETTPYTLLVEDNELRTEPEYHAAHWEGREKSLRKIQAAIGMPTDKRILTCHGFAILSAKVLESLKTKFMIPRSKTYIDILEIAAYEFSWYNFWLQHDCTIPIHVREPLFKCFHTKNQHIEYLFKKITQTDVARGYLGVIVNSNFSRDFGVISFDDDQSKVLSTYFSRQDLVKALIYKVKRKWMRLLKQ